LAEHVARTEGDEKCIKDLVTELEGRRPFGRLRCRWEGNPQTDLKEKVVDWIHLVQGMRALLLGVKRPDREADHSPPSSGEVKE